jgi:hypothetical protein
MLLFFGRLAFLVERVKNGGSAGIECKVASDMFS